MYLFENKVQYSLPSYKIQELYFQGITAAAIDIETTGLSSKHHPVILIGVLSPAEKDSWNITQFFARSPDEEAEILHAFFQFIEPYDLLFNYNGTSFDLPFLNRRSQHLHLNMQVPLHKSFDLYRVIQTSYLSEILPDLKLKTIESFLGVSRKDQISGQESTRLYQKYLASKDERLLHQILLHNQEDLSSFLSCLPIFQKINFHQSVFRHGFPVACQNKVLYVQAIQLLPSGISARGKISDASMDYQFYQEDFTFSLDHQSGNFLLHIFQNHIPTEYRQINLLVKNVLQQISF